MDGRWFVRFCPSLIRATGRPARARAPDPGPEQLHTQEGRTKPCPGSFLALPPVCEEEETRVGTRAVSRVPSGKLEQ